MGVGLVILLCCFANYRLCRLVAFDGITEPLRAAATKRLGAKHPMLLELMTCPWCLSVWFGAALVAAVDAFYPLPLPALIWPVASAGAGLLNTVETALDPEG